MSRCLTLLLLGISLVVAGTAQAQNDLFPNTKERGRAAIEYRDDAIQFVAAYYYSQRNHDSVWLLIEAGVSTEERMTVHRDAIRLITPDGEALALATQESFGRDIERTRQLIQNAALTRHGIGSYFNRRPQSERFRFFTLPGRGTVADDFVVDRFRAAFGDLFFEAPTGAWEEGTYMLVLEHEGVRAAVPIELE
ncbi:MAG: hypothetical protein V3T48_14115 [Vicinamibacterales bacterium]